MSSTPHIALLPSAGMGHLTPFLRLAAALSDRNCLVSLVTIHPTVSASESRHITEFFTAYPHINSLDLRLPSLPSAPGQDPFFLHFEAIRRSSAELLPPLLSSVSTPVTALVTDISLLSTTVPITNSIGLPCYTLFTASATMLAFCAFFSQYVSAQSSEELCDVDMPGIGKIPKRSIPLPLHNPTHLFTTQFIANGRALTECEGILVNTFDSLEPQALEALNSGKVLAGLPPVIAIGPLKPLPSTQPSSSSLIHWLDEQPENSVLYVSFGSRTAMSTNQIKELAAGLESSGCRFLWVLKTTIVDRDDNETLLDDILGLDYKERLKSRGLVAHTWIEQQQVLQHPSVGAFLSHCGWNSVTEAAIFGRMILAWPMIGDQRINAEVVKRCGLGEWVEKWSWEGEEEVVKANEIAKKVKEVIGDDESRKLASRIGGKAAEAVGAGGKANQGFKKFEERLGGLV